MNTVVEQIPDHLDPIKKPEDKLKNVLSYNLSKFIDECYDTLDKVKGTDRTIVYDLRIVKNEGCIQLAFSFMDKDELETALKNQKLSINGIQDSIQSPEAGLPEGGK